MRLNVWVAGLIGVAIGLAAGLLIGSLTTGSLQEAIAERDALRGRVAILESEIRQHLAMLQSELRQHEEPESAGPVTEADAHVAALRMLGVKTEEEVEKYEAAVEQIVADLFPKEGEATVHQNPQAEEIRASDRLLLVKEWSFDEPIGDMWTLVASNQRPSGNYSWCKGDIYAFSKPGFRLLDLSGPELEKTGWRRVVVIEAGGDEDGWVNDGFEKSWGIDGNRKLTPWDMGAKTGREQVWWPNGQMKLDECWDNGVKIGLHRQWYENGQKKSEIRYYSGEEGFAQFWDTDGAELQRVEAYERR